MFFVLFASMFFLFAEGLGSLGWARPPSNGQLIPDVANDRLVKKLDTFVKAQDSDPSFRSKMISDVSNFFDHIRKGVVNATSISHTRLSIEDYKDLRQNPAEVVPSTTTGAIITTSQHAIRRLQNVKQHAPFEEIVYINRNRRIDRRAEMEERLQTQSTSQYSRFSAIELLSLTEPPKTDPAKTMFIAWLPKRAASIDPEVPPNQRVFVASVFLSHLSIWERILAEKLGKPGHEDDLYLILEDDAQFMPAWEHRLRSVMCEVPEDWDVLRLGTWGSKRRQDYVTQRVARAKGPFKEKIKGKNNIFYAGMHAVVVRPRTLPRLVDYMRSRLITDIDEMVTSDQINSYVLVDPLIVVDRINESDHPIATNAK